MDKNQSLYLTSGHAALYAKYRVKSPQIVFKSILAYLGQEVTPPYGHALDFGCGNGQSTQWLAEHFERVTGLDISEAQLDEAKKGNKLENISLGTETNLPFESRQLQLVTVSQCHHWLDLPAFYEGVKQVLVPRGVLAIYFHQMPLLIDETNKSSSFENMIIDLSADMERFRHEKRKIFKDLDFYFPFADVVKDHFTVDHVWTVPDVCGYVRSWSPYQWMLMSEPERAKKVLDDFQEKLLVAISSEKRNPDKVTVTIRLHYCLIIGRNG